MICPAVALWLGAAPAVADEASFIALLREMGVPQGFPLTDPGLINAGAGACRMLREGSPPDRVNFGIAVAPWRSQIVEAAQRELCPETLSVGEPQPELQPSP